jgi:hypothetical protein
MASNAKLIKQIEEAATRKGVDRPETEDKRNAELTAILRDLNARPDAPAAGTLADKMLAAAAAKNAEAGEVTEEQRAASLAEMSEQGTDTGGDTPPEYPPEEREPEPAPAAPFSIAEGKALTCKRGMIAEGEEVTAGDFPGGEERLAELVKSGHVVKA